MVLEADVIKEVEGLQIGGIDPAEHTKVLLGELHTVINSKGPFRAEGDDAPSYLPDMEDLGWIDIYARGGSFFYRKRQKGRELFQQLMGVGYY